MSPKPLRFVAAALALAAGSLFVAAFPAQADIAPGAFVSVPPARILDTRPAPDNVGVAPGKVPAHTDVTFQVAGRGGVPATGAAAVVLNVAVTGTTAPGVVTAHPANEAAPTAANLNYVAGQTISNHVTVKLSPSGEVSLLNDSNAPIHLIADVNGWYAAGTAAAAGTFTPMSPKRLLDTRPAPDNVGVTPGKIPGQGTVDFAVAGVSPIPDPSQVGAGVFNFAVTAPTMAGFLTGYPTGTAKPNAANLNYVAGQTISNAATVKLGTAGKVTLANGQLSTSSDAHYIADANGWFRAGAAAVGGAYTPVNPKRIMDTRPAPNNVGVPVGKVPANSSITVTINGDNGVPDMGATAAVMNLAVTNATAPGHITAYPTYAPRPNTANLNFDVGDTISNLVTVRLGNHGKVNFYNASSQPVDLVADLAGWYKAGPPPASQSAITDWANWNLTLPVDTDWKGGNTTPATISQPALATFQDPMWFHMNDDGDGVVFRANAGGATTSGTNYPRSELREMNGSTKAAWSGLSGTHIMTITQAITHLPDVKPQVVAGQIHDTNDDQIEIRLHGTTLYAWHIDSSQSKILDNNYQLGTKFKVEVRSDSTGVTISYWNPVNAASPVVQPFPGLTSSSTPWYFKAGCYPQTNESKGDDFTAYGEVIIYSVTVQHLP